MSTKVRTKTGPRFATKIRKINAFELFNSKILKVKKMLIIMPPPHRRGHQAMMMYDVCLSDVCLCQFIYY